MNIPSTCVTVIGHFRVLKGTTFLVKMIFICKRMKTHSHIKGWALNLVLIQRPGVTRKWSSAWWVKHQSWWPLQFDPSGGRVGKEPAKTSVFPSRSLPLGTFRAKLPQRWRARTNGSFHRLKIFQLNIQFRQINEAYLLLYFFRQVWKETRIYGSLVSGCIVWLHLGNRTASSDLGVFTWSLRWCSFQLDLRCSSYVFQTGPWFILHLHSLRGRRLKGKGKGVLGARETREARPSRFPRAQNPLSLPFQTPATQAILQAVSFKLFLKIKWRKTFTSKLFRWSTHKGRKVFPGVKIVGTVQRDANWKNSQGEG